MRVGIVTMYHNCTNYGGNLQAYALRKICEEFGHEAEVISYYNGARYRYCLGKIKRLLNLGNKGAAQKSIRQREKTIKRFRDAISHSPLFFRKNIAKINERYDCLIVGSDQVWNPRFLNPFYTLQFADKSKYCFSYAASMGVLYLNEEHKDVFADILNRLQAVSVREGKSIEILKEVSDKPVELVLDPTLLLDAEKWGDVAAPKQIDEKYVFCFLFGEQKKPRDLAVRYAEKHNCKLVTIPFLHGVFRDVDVNFGDYQLSKIGPEQFLSLIKYAEFIFTDSFHAAIFSHIFKKQFIVYAHDDNESNARLFSLTKLFKTESRFVRDELETDFSYVESLAPVDYDSSKTDVTEMRKYSLNFIENNLCRGKT